MTDSLVSCDKSALRPIPGFPGYYAREDGNIVSFRRGCGRVLARTEYNPRPKRSTQRRYLQYTMRDAAGRLRHCNGHVLVALAWLGCRPAGAVIRHLNGVGTDNRPSNLAYGSVSQNLTDTDRHCLDKLIAHFYGVEALNQLKGERKLT